MNLLRKRKIYSAQQERDLLQPNSNPAAFKKIYGWLPDGVELRDPWRQRIKAPTDLFIENMRKIQENERRKKGKI